MDGDEVRGNGWEWACTVKPVQNSGSRTFASASPTGRNSHHLEYLPRAVHGVQRIDPLKWLK